MPSKKSTDIRQVPPIALAHDGMDGYQCPHCQDWCEVPWEDIFEEDGFWDGIMNCDICREAFQAIPILEYEDAAEIIEFETIKT